MSANEVSDIALHLALSTYRYTTLYEYTLRTQGDTRTAIRAAATYDIKTGRPLDKIDKDHKGEYTGPALGGYNTTTPQGERVGIAGFGGIGQALAKRLHALGMDVHYFKRHKLSEDEENSDPLKGIPLTYHDSFESLAKVSDLLALALPLTDETRHTLNEETIKLLPDRAKVVNVGRGALIHEDALVQALKSGKVASAGLDVFEYEPEVHPELLKRLDVTIFPHIGGRTPSSAARAIENCFQNLKNILVDGGTGLTPVRD
ncbi:glyoxylate reductase [Sugiyamaella lignohabitans]|uniref:Glyoxylate reductase n=1 Tax=Sugiyamaella lignohabitans TaxID=796027 RepID=A0A161HI14_9ASCO|nr:glyoxylate reductase [Sugiyamaella lignohabitans]ANB15850.1 glyoxylate reductase [Sugiyamaella lignohabitans]